VRRNARGSRWTLRGTLGGTPVYIKVFRGPSALLRAWRTRRNAERLRRFLPDRAPALLHSQILWAGYLCVLVYQQVAGHTLDWLRRPHDPELQVERALSRLVALFAAMHEQGICQSDTNLTNFIDGPAQVQVLDDDDLRFTNGSLSEAVALSNLASLLARLEWLADAEHEHWLVYYAEQRGWPAVTDRQRQRYRAAVAHEQLARKHKRARRQRGSRGER